MFRNLGNSCKIFAKEATNVSRHSQQDCTSYCTYTCCWAELAKIVQRSLGGRHYLYPACKQSMGCSGSVDGFIFRQNHWLATGRTHAGSINNRSV